MRDIDIIKKACREYLRARKKILAFALSPKSNGLLNGNDNIIGSRIGEFIAWQLLKSQNRKPRVNEQANIEGFDIICDIAPKRVSVKLISPESRNGRAARLGNKWDEFILIELNADYKIKSIGQINKRQFNEAVKSGAISKNPHASRSMLGERGLFRFGKIITKEKASGYL